jgi:hypothetical protein
MNSSNGVLEISYLGHRAGREDVGEQHTAFQVARITGVSLYVVMCACHTVIFNVYGSCYVGSRVFVSSISVSLCLACACYTTHGG